MSGRRVALYFVAFFGLIAAVNAAMVTMAIRTHSGVVTEHPYEKGLAYNTVVRAEEAQEALGWKASVSHEKGMLKFVLRDKQGAVLAPEKAVATVTRPTQSGMDFSVTLTGEATPITFPAQGLWEVRGDATHGGTSFQKSQRIVVQ
jgi:nitrogen fixation protein FixH